MSFLIFKTKKKDEKSTEFRGQVPNNDLRTISSATKRTTGESPKTITKGDGTSTAVTENDIVDFIDKDLLGGVPPNKYIGGEIPL